MQAQSSAHEGLVRKASIGITFGDGCIEPETPNRSDFNPIGGSAVAPQNERLLAANMPA
jgi:hypothetical protein